MTNITVVFCCNSCGAGYQAVQQGQCQLARAASTAKFAEAKFSPGLMGMCTWTGRQSRRLLFPTKMMVHADYAISPLEMRTLAFNVSQAFFEENAILAGSHGRWPLRSPFANCIARPSI
jgi:hypothetical protein